MVTFSCLVGSFSSTRARTFADVAVVFDTPTGNAYNDSRNKKIHFIFVQMEKKKITMLDMSGLICRLSDVDVCIIAANSRSNASSSAENQKKGF